MALQCGRHIQFNMTDKTTLRGKIAVYCTLGCKLNFAETSTFERKFSELGVRTAVSGEQADMCVINTCTVTEVADHKCRQAIRRLVRENPGAFVVVTGCYAQRDAARVSAIEGVDLVLGANEKARLVEMVVERMTHSGGNADGHLHESHTVKTKDIKTFAPSCARGNRTRYFLKVQDGCDYFCTYCTIPYARGFSRNPTIASLVAMAERVADEGGREIVLTGVNIGDFGKSTGERFVDLVKALDGVEGISRYRISSLEPDLISDELVDFCASSRAFMPHFHIPLQSGSDEVLRLMHRHYDTALFRDRVERIKRAMPSAFIGVDVMVGCRGETPALFEQTFDFLNSLDVSQLHVFPYSERPGTAALRIPYIVDDEDKKQRSQRLLELSASKLRQFYSLHVGAEADVLFERAPQGHPMHGFTPNYIRAELPPQSPCELDNQILHVRLGGFNSDNTALKATIIDG